MRSMTGFGRFIMEEGGLTQQWEIRSVNSKRLELKWQLPSAVRGLESRLEKTVKRFAARGRLDVSLSLQSQQGVLAPRFDEAQAAGMLEALENLAEARKDEFIPDYNVLLGVSALWSAPTDEVDESLAASLENGLSQALADWNESRETEGAALARDLQDRILRMAEWTELVKERAPAIRAERAQALRDRVNEQLASLNVGEIDEQRFLQEVVTLTDRLDVAEELTRLSTHLDRLQELLQEQSDVGRRLDFTLQECFREINTCGNKIPDVQLSRLVVDYKNELERCREQVQNLE
ncbi:MAG: YicC family protein [Desulfovibrio sp.]|nr:YicC family protein [Desulfovibrio sp.]